MYFSWITNHLYYKIHEIDVAKDAGEFRNCIFVPSIYHLEVCYVTFLGNGFTILSFLTIIFFSLVYFTSKLHSNLSHI